MSESEIETMIKYPNEERYLEFKRSIKWDGDIRAKITKSIMAFANLDRSNEQIFENKHLKEMTKIFSEDGFSSWTGQTVGDRSIPNSKNDRSMLGTLHWVMYGL